MNPEPLVRRKFVLADLHNNHNKFWLVEYWPEGRLKTTWGRVGVTPQCKEKSDVSIHEMQKLIHEKETKGYVEIDLHRPATPVTVEPSLDARVASLVDLIYSEANDNIASYLAVGVDALSQAQISEGRERLVRIQKMAHSYWKGRRKAKQQVTEAVEEYLNVIPTRLPARIEIDTVVSSFITNLAEHEDRLNQLEAALATYAVQDASSGSQLAGLGGVTIEVMEPKTKAHKQIRDYVQRTSNGGRRVREIFSVTIPTEREAWERDTRGKSNICALFHGTRSCNVRHILRSGLIIPRMPANGRRMGGGVYFADRARRSLNYCGGQRPISLLFVADVALGKPVKLNGTHSYLTKPPDGYDSVWGIESWSGDDEFIVYSTAQQTIRALVIVE